MATKSTKLPRSIRRLFPKTKYVIDARTPIKVIVNRKDCDTGKRLDPTECALAKATKREFNADRVIIGLGASYIIKGTKATRFHTPQSVQREIISFDRHSDFAPGEYVLPPKSPSLRFGKDRRKRTKSRGGDNKSATRKVHTSARVRVLPHGG